MKKRSFILTALLPVLCFSMVACGKSSDSKPSSKDKPSLIAKSQEAAPHQDKRLAFENIHIASADQEFKGGSSIEDLTNLFGSPSKHEKKPAGNVTLDHYTWTFDKVTIQANMYQNSTIVKSIANFAFNRKPKISLKDYNKLQKGMTYNQVTRILTEPDDYTHASSSDKIQRQAVWISGLKANAQGSHINLLFENDKLIQLSQRGLLK
ncbi:DUF3862 domain-containing protein [Streptococcus pseudoporcinus]|uniref:Lipoprotein n=1 Tax=Streptococcus pseudoporcinus LQ 940-04 TaxID=875093 RepID=G5KC48_9STRE|nr:DUF3862 domain-containing protein [Streptococcus pseudoporcinus]EFR44497.1 hypothetical protein HMPREF9320_0560 [Streptococcus pseudoporcinus SPIN 20026]EHI64583.1 putative lipoprotein [Streptococcus pseudoporcinus LQ 940-04]VEF93045.1 lipoprotein [Streptococcus pseudoporcinus]